MAVINKVSFGSEEGGSKDKREWGQPGSEQVQYSSERLMRLVLNIAGICNITHLMNGDNPTH